MCETSEAKVADFDDARRSDEDIGWFQVAVDNMGLMQIEETIQKLVRQRLEHGGGDGGAEGLSMMMNDLLSLCQ